MLRSLVIALVMLLLAPSLIAQEVAPPASAFGAPRRTLAYFTGDAETLKSLLGHREKGFFWESSFRERAEDLKPRIAAYDRAIALAQKPEAEKRLAELTTTREKLAKEWNAQEGARLLFESLRPSITGASRVDLALVDLTNSGPKLFLDITLAEGHMPSLRPEGIEKHLKVFDREESGIAMLRYVSPRLEFPISVFTREGHLYVAFYRDVANELAQGLAAPANDGESLAEASAFLEWYRKPRKSMRGLYGWLNAHNWRRLLESTESLFLPSLQEALKRMQQEVELRLWRYASTELHYRSDTKTLDADFAIATRREIKLFTELAAPTMKRGLLKSLPSDIDHSFAIHLKDPRQRWERLHSLSRDLVTAFTSSWALQDKEEPKKDSKEDPTNEESKEKVEPPEKAKEALAPKVSHPIDSFLESVNELLKPSGDTFTQALGKLEGEIVVGVYESQSTERPSTLIALISISDHEATRLALENFIKKKIANKQEGYLSSSDGELSLYRLGDSWVTLVGDIAALAYAADAEDQAKTQLLRIAATLKIQSDAEATSSSLSLRFDLRKNLLRRENASRKNDRTLDRGQAIRPPLAEQELLGEKLTITSALTFTNTSMKLALRIEGFQANHAAIQFFGLTRADQSPYFATDALHAAYGRIKKLPILPSRAEGLVSAGIPRALLQSPFDSHYEGAPRIPFLPLRRRGWDDFNYARTVAIIQANSKKPFLSYSVAPLHGRKLKSLGGRIFLFQSSPETYGGRVVLYGNGHVGWIHESNWPDAKKLMKADEQIPLADAASNMSAKSQDTDTAVAMNIVRLYNTGIRKAPYRTALHTSPKAGQSYTITTTNLKSKEEREQVITVAHVGNDGKAIVEYRYPEGYVLSLEVDTTKASDEANVTRAWVGRAGSSGLKAVVATAPVPAPNKPKTPSPWKSSTENIKDFEIAGKTFAAKKTTYTLIRDPKVTSINWTSEEAWFSGFLKSTSSRSSVAISKIVEDSEASLSYAHLVKAVEKPKEGEKTAPEKK